jgi:hypothetical protein
MHESPFLGWIVPRPWQEADYDDATEEEEEQVDDDVDEDGYLIEAN